MSRASWGAPRSWREWALIFTALGSLATALTFIGNAWKHGRAVADGYVRHEASAVVRDSLAELRRSLHGAR